MKAITLRNIPPDLARRIRRRASQKGLSINKAVLSLLMEATGTRDGDQTRVHLHHDLDSLAGSWTREEAAAFDRNLTTQRSIDPEVWK